MNFSQFQTPRMIEAQEKEAAETMGCESKVLLPISDVTSECAQKLIQQGVQFGERKDKVLVHAILPAGWKIMCDNDDPRPRPRRRKLMNHENAEIASIFLKHTCYDYYGGVTFI